MHRKNHQSFAELLNHALGNAESEECFHTVYDLVYEPMVKLFEADNERFDRKRFDAATFAYLEDDAILQNRLKGKR